MRTLSALVLGFAVAGLAAAQEKKDDAAKLVGKWEITKSTGDAPVGTLVEFTKDGKLKITATIGDKKIELEGTYTVEKDKLKTKVTSDGKTEEDVDTIKKLTDDEMELEDQKKNTITLKKKK